MTIVQKEGSQKFQQIPAQCCSQFLVSACLICGAALQFQGTASSLCDSSYLDAHEKIHLSTFLGYIQDLSAARTRVLSIVPFRYWRRQMSFCLSDFVLHNMHVHRKEITSWMSGLPLLHIQKLGNHTVKQSRTSSSWWEWWEWWHLQSLFLCTHISLL